MVLLFNCRNIVGSNQKPIPKPISHTTYLQENRDPRPRQSEAEKDPANRVRGPK